MALSDGEHKSVHVYQGLCLRAALPYILGALNCYIVFLSASSGPMAYHVRQYKYNSSGLTTGQL
jgi:hypothetical protein